MAINRVVLVGNLTRDVELRHTPGGTAVTTLRIACNTRRKNAQGDWVDKPNYFDVEVWGRPAENAAQYLAKGRAVAVDGQLEWQEYEHQGQQRQKVFVRADSVQFLGGRGEGERREGATQAEEAPASASVPSAADAEALPF
jgi:single-strand DNA-binding protein